MKRVVAYNRINNNLWSRKFLYETGDQWMMDNGYEKRLEPIYRDGQGRLWGSYADIDFSAPRMYIRLHEVWGKIEPFYIVENGFSRRVWLHGRHPGHRVEVLGRSS